MNLDFTPHVRHAAKSTYYLKAHVKAYDNRMIYFLSGKGTFLSDGEEYKLLPGTLMFYPPATEYRITASEGATFYSLNFDFDKKRTDLTVMSPVESKKFVPSSVISSLPEDLKAIFSKKIYLPGALFAEGDLSVICKEFITDEVGNAEICSALLKKVLIEIIRKAERRAEENTLSELIKDTVSKIPSASNGEIAEKLGYHPYYLSSYLKKTEGISLHRYVLKQRLKLAYVDILSTATPIDDIAVKYGFSSGAHFSVAFKKEYGINPGTLRRT